MLGIILVLIILLLFILLIIILSQDQKEASNLPHLPPQEGDNWYSPDANQSLIVEQKKKKKSSIFSWFSFIFFSYTTSLLILFCSLVCLTIKSKTLTCFLHHKAKLWLVPFNFLLVSSSLRSWNFKGVITEQLCWR